jgi:cupin fold WbuC family metalloprotein
MDLVLFLCTGNYFRSRFAEQWFNHRARQLGLDDQVQACSAGLGVRPDSGNVGPMAKEALAALRERGLELDPADLALPHQVSRQELEQASCVIAVDAEAHRPMVQAQCPDWEEQITFWSVKDLGEGEADADPIVQLQGRVEQLLQRWQVQLKRIDQHLLDAVATEARQRERLRRNHNLHRESDLVQRFLNALQPGTYVRPHRHVRAEAGTGFECFLVLQGALGLLVLDAQGHVLRQERLSAKGSLRGVELAENQFHTLVALEPDTVMFELKQGPYIPTADKDFLPMFPLEGTPEAQDQELRWRDLFNGSGPSSEQ